MPRIANASDEQILKLTNELIAKHDVSGITVDMIASKAGVSKATLYRRWPSRDVLIFDALTIMHRPTARPDTGSLQGDLSILLTELIQFLNRRNGGKVFMALLNEAIRNPELARANSKITEEVRASYVNAIKRAIARGELSPEVDLELMIDFLIAPFIYRKLSGNAAVNEADIAPVINAAIKAWRAR